MMFIPIKQIRHLRGNSWFWGLLKDGESGKELWDRLPPSNTSQFPDIIRWTKVTSGNMAAVIIDVKQEDGSCKAFAAGWDYGRLYLPDEVGERHGNER